MVYVKTGASGLAGFLSMQLDSLELKSFACNYSYMQCIQGKPIFMRILLGILILTLSWGITQAHPGVGILEDSKGNVYYTDLEQVWKISPAGIKTVAVPGVHTHELYIDEHDNLYGEHLWYNGEQKNTWGHYVWKLSALGKLEKVIPNTEGFLENYSFVRDHFGRMYWADRSKPCQTVVRKNADNTQARMGSHCFDNIRKIEALSDGSILLVDFQDLKKIDNQGRLTTVGSKIANKKWVVSTVENQNSVMGIWEDNQGNLFAAVSSEGIIKKFTKNGKEEIAFKSSLFWAPSGGMVDRLDNLWVLEFNKINQVRVTKVGTDKRKQIY